MIKVKLLYYNIGVGDGGQGGRGQGRGTCPPPQNSGKLFFGQLLCKIQAFGGKNRVKLGNFLNFRGKYHKKFGYFDNFSYIFLGKMSCPLKLTELLHYAF